MIKKKDIFLSQQQWAGGGEGGAKAYIKNCQNLNDKILLDENSTDYQYINS